MTATLLASTALVILTLTAASARSTAGGWAEFRQFADHRSYLIQKTQRVRERRCLDPRRVFHRNYWFRGRPGLYAAATKNWRRKLRHDMARDSVCERAIAARWSRTTAAECVSAKEGGVRSNTGNGYFGRWQADLDFQRTYGGEFLRRWGTANNWPRWAQDVMAYRGWQARSWYPWPNTARECGLLP